jgi:hypothetical protein
MLAIPNSTSNALRPSAAPRNSSGSLKSVVPGVRYGAKATLNGFSSHGQLGTGTLHTQATNAQTGLAKSAKVQTVYTVKSTSWVLVHHTDKVTASAQPSTAVASVTR